MPARPDRSVSYGPDPLHRPEQGVQDHRGDAEEVPRTRESREGRLGILGLRSAGKRPSFPVPSRRGRTRSDQGGGGHRDPDLGGRQRRGDSRAGPREQA
eukprot:6264615-Pyramimonas_sp.AAC.1